MEPDDGIDLPPSMLPALGDAGAGGAAGGAGAAVYSEEQTMLCPDCGTLMPVNAAGLCVNCIRSTVDITEGIPKQGVLYHCRGCDRYLNPPDTWVLADLESRELLALCLKRQKGLSKVKMVDAGFIWTEPHSRRIKVKLTVQKEVMHGAILQQVFVVEHVIHNQMCDDCHRREAKDTWSCVVQVRQKVKHKKTFYYLEQLIIKHRVHKNCVNILSRPDGVDFFFATKSHGKKLVDFLNSQTVAKFKLPSEQLISADIQSGTANYKFAYAVEIAPVCRGDVACLGPTAVRKCGNMSPIVLVHNVASVIHLLDPMTLQYAEVTTARYMLQPFNSICTHKEHTEFVILDIEPVLKDGVPVVVGKWALAEALVARERDLGTNEIQYTVRTHLGNVLQAGDLAWGFDLVNANVNDEYANKLDARSLPDVILVKKSYSERRRRRRRRNWKLQQISRPMDAEGSGKDIEMAAADYEDFLQDLEEDGDLRANVNIYKDSTTGGAADEAQTEFGDDDLKISLDEMLNEFDEMDLGAQDDDDDDGADSDDPESGGRPVDGRNAKRSKSRT